MAQFQVVLVGYDTAPAVADVFSATATSAPLSLVPVTVWAFTFVGVVT